MYSQKRVTNNEEKSPVSLKKSHECKEKSHGIKEKSHECDVTISGKLCKKALLRTLCKISHFVKRHCYFVKYLPFYKMTYFANSQYAKWNIL